MRSHENLHEKWRIHPRPMQSTIQVNSANDRALQNRRSSHQRSAARQADHARCCCHLRSACLARQNGRMLFELGIFFYSILTTDFSGSLDRFSRFIISIKNSSFKIKILEIYVNHSMDLSLSKIITHPLSLRGSSTFLIGNPLHVLGLYFSTVVSMHLGRETSDLYFNPKLSIENHLKSQTQTWNKSNQSSSYRVSYCI